MEVAVREFRRIAPGVNLTEETEGQRFVGALAAFAGKNQSLPGEFEGVL
jgi:hypothetical protein